MEGIVRDWEAADYFEAVAVVEVVGDSAEDGVEVWEGEGGLGDVG